MKRGPSPQAHRATLIVFLTVMAILPAHDAGAAVPATMTYQGSLKTLDGQPLPDGNHSFTFRLYNIETGGTPLWQENQTLPTGGGLFHALLGSVTPLNLPFDAQYWIESVVDGTLLSPRVKLASSPYAQRAAVAESLVGGAGDISAVYADNGLTGGAVSGDAHLNVGAGTGIEVAADAVGLSAAYSSGSAYDTRFVNEGQSNAVTADMIQPNVVGSVDGVSNDAGNVDLVAGSNVTITPDNVNKTITIAATGGGGIGGSGSPGFVSRFIGSTTLGNSLLFDDGAHVVIGQAPAFTGITATIGSTSDSYEEARLMVRGLAFPEVILSHTYPDSPNDGAGGMVTFQGVNGEHEWDIHRTIHPILGGGGVLHFTADGLDDVLTLGKDQSSFFSYSRGMSDATLLAQYVGSGSEDVAAVKGVSHPVDYFGVGGSFLGGYCGVVAQVWPTGSQDYYGTYSRVVGAGGSGTNYGVYAVAQGAGLNYGLFARASGGWGNLAGVFDGDVQVIGNLTVTGSKAFRIDHPADPANRYLNHFAMESSEVLNTYSGNVVLDSGGEAWVQLGDWFESINRDPRYQLTCIGGSAPVYVAEEVSGNRFKIAGGRSGLKVSWQVTAVRNDAAIQKYRVPVEQDKPVALRGKYLEPSLYGLPETMKIGYQASKVPAR